MQLNRHYPLTVLDPGAAGLTRLLKVTDQLVVVVPANVDAAGALADTRDWLDNNGHADLAMQSVTVINGVSRRSLPDVEQRRVGRPRPVARDRPRPVGRHAAGGRRRPVHAPPADARRLHRACRGARRRTGRRPGKEEAMISERARTAPTAQDWGGAGEREGRRGAAAWPIRYFDDRVLLTDTHAWAYYRVPSVSYEFTTPDEREALATNITVALAAIRMQDAEVHLRIAHRPYPAVEWATGLDATSDGGPGWREYLEQIYQHVWAKDFWSKEIYLGVRLGQRSVRAQLTDGLFGDFLNTYRGRGPRPGPGGGRAAARRGRQVDGAGGAARPRAHRVRARRAARVPPARWPGCSGTR